MSVRPSIFFICEKHSKPRGNRATGASVYFNGQRTAIVANSNTATAVCVCGVYVHAFARVRAHACMRLFVRA